MCKLALLSLVWLKTQVLKSKSCTVQAVSWAQILFLGLDYYNEASMNIDKEKKMEIFMIFL